MSIKKRFSAWLLVILMVLQLCPLAALAEEVTYSNELRVDFSKVQFVNGNQTIVQWAKTGEGTLVFPETPTTEEEGVSFVGWKKSDNSFAVEGETVSEDMTLTATFDAPTYYTVTILYQYNGVDVANSNIRAYRPQDSAETIESPSPVPNPDPVEGGYLFPVAGTDGTGYSYSGANITVTPAEL